MHMCSLDLRSLHLSSISPAAPVSRVKIPGVNDARKPAEKVEYEIQEQLHSAPTLEGSHERWQEDRDDKKEKISPIEVITPVLRA